MAVISTASSGNTQLAAAVAGKTIVVTGYTFLCAGDVSVGFKSANTAITGSMPFPENGGICNQPTGVVLFQCVEGEALNIALSDAVQVSGHINYKYI